MPQMHSGNPSTVGSGDNTLVSFPFLPFVSVRIRTMDTSVPLVCYFCPQQAG